MRRVAPGAALAAALALSLPTAGARPQYAKVFSDRYQGLKAVFMRIKCKKCHCLNGKKTFND